MKVIREGTPPTKTVECHNCNSILEVLYSDLVFRSMFEIKPGLTQLGGYYVRCPVCGCENYVEWFEPIIIKPHDTDQ